jgi:hypothetical protein
LLEKSVKFRQFVAEYENFTPWSVIIL